MVPTWLRKYLSNESLQQLEGQIENIEKQTSAEIVMVVQRKSSAMYQELSLLLLSFGAMFFITQDSNLFFATVIGGVLIYSLKKKVDKIESENQAFKNLQKLILGKTHNQTGVLIFLSLTEKQAYIMGEAQTGLTAADYETVIQKLVVGLKQENLAEALGASLDYLGTKLSTTCPPETINLNQLPNQLIIQGD